MLTKTSQGERDACRIQRRDAAILRRRVARRAVTTTSYHFEEECWWVCVLGNSPFDWEFVKGGWRLTLPIVRGRRHSASEFLVG